MADSELSHSGATSRVDLPNSAPSKVNPESLRGFQAQLTKGKDAVDPARWAGSVSPEPGIA
ncbi:MAG: hypothetical protein M3492_01395, partial [Actinomycetota bacterium]|nr:hypothetical protein [Actinomycetota bacterium]